MFVPKPTAKRRKNIAITQGAPSGGGFKKGYQSFVTDSRTPLDALNDLTNATLDQDNLPRPRPSLMLFGEQPLGTVLGVGTFIKTVAGVPEKWDISMQVIGGVGKVHTRKDGNTWVAATGTNSYDATAQANFCQTGDRVYISNAVNAMSYFNNATGAMVVYTALGTPSAPSAVATGIAGANCVYYYRITGNNSVGESIASVAGSVDTTKYRDIWTAASEYVTVTWSALSGATSYNIYVGSVAGEEEYLVSVSSTLTFRDDGSLTANTFKRAPSGNSTAGPILKTMWNKDGQLYGVGDTSNLSYLWYDGGSAGLGDFSPFNGGGNVPVNEGGDTTPQAVRSFRTGKGDSAVTVLSRGVAGSGKMHHIVFTSTTFDGNVITIPNVQEANGQAGTVSADAVVEANNSLWYPTGQDFKSTGTAVNVQNILSTNSVANDILPDVQRLNLSAMNKSKGLVFENKIYWALPVGSTGNNQIWIKDLSRKGIWIMPWVISAQFMWLSEDNTTGQIDFCIYDGTNILALTRSVKHQDNGVAFRSRVAHEGMVWSDSGMTMAAIQEQRFKFLEPSGTIQVNSFGLDEDGAVNTLASDTFSQVASFTGWAQLVFSDGSIPSVFSGDVGAIDFTSTQIHITTLDIDETVNQLGWEVIGEVVDTDYLLSTTHTNGIEVPKLYFGD